MGDNRMQSECILIILCASVCVCFDNWIFKAEHFYEHNIDSKYSTLYLLYLFIFIFIIFNIFSLKSVHAFAFFEHLLNRSVHICICVCVYVCVCARVCVCVCACIGDPNYTQSKSPLSKISCSSFFF